MKNIHVIPTDKPSRLIINWEKDLCYKSKPYLMEGTQNICITSDEEIKVGDWYYLPRTNGVYKCNEDATELNLERRLGVSKVILTTDQDLDGVQEIPEYFLIHYIMGNNPIEYVEIKEHLESIDTMKINYELIIPKEEQCTCKEHDPYCCKVHGICPTCCPKEEPKKETLEEAAEKFTPKSDKWTIKQIFIEGAKWQQQNSYSEEDLKDAFFEGWIARDGKLTFTKAKNKWFKKK